MSVIKPSKVGAMKCKDNKAAVMASVSMKTEARGIHMKCLDSLL